MDNQYVVYANATGVIAYTLSQDEELAANNVTDFIEIGQAYLIFNTEEARPNTHYVSVSGTHTVTPKPFLTDINTLSSNTIVANGTHTVTFGSSLPNPTEIEIIPLGINGVDSILGTVTDGNFAFSTTTAGQYLLRFRAFPYQDYDVTIGAT